MIGVGTSLLFGRRAGKAGPPIPPFNKDIGLTGYFSNMALYKLIGFYDELTPLQIEKVINDYKLKYD